MEIIGLIEDKNIKNNYRKVVKKQKRLFNRLNKNLLLDQVICNDCGKEDLQHLGYFDKITYNNKIIYQGKFICDSCYNKRVFGWMKKQIKY